MYYHNPKFTLIRPSHDEMRTIGATAVERLNRAKGPVTVVLPLKGMSIGGLEGGVTHDPKGDRILFETIKQGLREDIPLIEAPLQVNEEAFADVVVNAFVKLISKNT
jgi:uncharacterized protein (UPF0261 family)